MADASPLNTVGAWVIAAYLFFLQSRVLDFTIPQLHIPLILWLGLVGISMLSGNILAGFRLRTGQLLILLIFFMAMSTLFSIDRRQSAMIVVTYVRHLAMCFAMLALLVTVKDIRRCLQAVAFATAAAAVLGFIFKVTVEGERLGLATGRFGDPNDYAMVLVMGFPFWLTVASGVPRLIIGLPAALMILVSFGRAGSRGGLLAFGAITAAYFFTSSFMAKLRVGAVLAILAVGAVAVVPEGIQRRYFTIFSVDEESSESAAQAQQGYINSSNSRKALFFSSLKASITHPLLGVGPGGFPQYYWQQGFIEEKRNRQGMHTHNTYTQVSSEAGIPAAICLISILFLCFRMAWRASQEKLLPPTHMLRVCGKALWLSMVGWASAAMFLSTAWTEVIFIYVALSGSLAAAHQKLIAGMQNQANESEKRVSNPPKPGPLRPSRTVLPQLRPIS